MRRGSATTWGAFAESTTANMAQLSESRTEFMTDGDRELRNKGGCFLSYARAICIVSLVLLTVIMAGFIGAYISSPVRKQKNDPLEFAKDDVEEEETTRITSLLFLLPSRYRLEITPVIVNNCVTELKGRVIIDFDIEGTERLSELPLIASNIATTRYKLLVLAGRHRRDVENETTEEESTALDKTVETTNRTEDSSTTINDTQAESANVVEDTISIPDNVTSTDNEEITVVNSKEEQTNVTSTDKEETIVANINKEKSPVTNTERIVETKESMDSNDSTMTTTTVENPANLNHWVEIPIEKYEADDANGIHVVHVVSQIGQGTYSLELDYELPMDDNEIYSGSFSGPNEGRWLSGTLLKAVGIGRLLPVFDNPAHKSVFTVSVKRPKDVVVLFNMPLKSSTNTSDDKILDTFHDTPLFSPEHLVLSMGSLEPIHVTKGTDSQKITFWSGIKVKPEELYIVDKVDRILNEMSTIFKTPYTLPKLDIISLPPELLTNAAYPGLIAIQESSFYAKRQSPIIAKKETLLTLIRLLGQQWLGGMVNMKNQSDTWILQGSLIYIQRRLITEIDSSLGLEHSFVADVVYDAMDGDGYGISKSLEARHQPNQMDSYALEDNYRKGACLIRMLHGAISNTAFRDGYKKFINRWKNTTADCEAFWAILEKEPNEFPSGVTLMEAVASWTFQGGYPVVTVTRNYEEGSALVRQHRFSYDSSETHDAHMWHIPLTYLAKNDDWSLPSKTWLDSVDPTIIDDVGHPRDKSWILFNVNKTGYYRVHYDDENWKLLAAELEQNHESFPAETRASLVDDIFSLAAGGLAKYEIAFDLIKYMQTKERHYAPWGVLMHHMFKLNNILYMTPVFADFQLFMLQLVSPLYGEVVAKTEEGSELTLIAVRMACAAENAACLEWADKSNSRTSNNTIAVPPYLREPLYCTIARYGNPEDWSYFLDRATSLTDEEEKNRLLSSFACFQVPWILQSVLNKVLNETTFTDDEVLIILRGFSKNPAAAQVAYRFVRLNWPSIVKRYAHSVLVMKSFILATIGGLTSQQDLEDLEVFRQNNYDIMKGVRYATAVVESNANFVTWWLTKFLPDLQRYIKGDVTGNVTSNTTSHITSDITSSTTSNIINNATSVTISNTTTDTTSHTTNNTTSNTISNAASDPISDPTSDTTSNSASYTPLN